MKDELPNSVGSTLLILILLLEFSSCESKIIWVFQNFISFKSSFEHNCMTTFCILDICKHSCFWKYFAKSPTGPKPIELSDQKYCKIPDFSNYQVLADNWFASRVGTGNAQFKKFGFRVLQVAQNAQNCGSGRVLGFRVPDPALLISPLRVVSKIYNKRNHTFTVS